MVALETKIGKCEWGMFTKGSSSRSEITSASDMRTSP